MPQRPARPSDAPTRALGDTSGGVDSRDLCLLLSYADGVSVIGLGERKELVLGRAATCDVVVPDDSVSRRHARLVVGDEGIFLEDLGSVNGTTVDGEKIRAATALRIGAAFELGKTTVLLQRSEGLTRHSKHTIPPGAAAAPVEKRSNPSTVVRDPAMKRLYALLDVVGPSPLSILVLGETGVGKEVFADAAHRASSRAARPFLRLNCAAVPESLFEGELFGYEKGAFTGATQAKAGLFESADGGTVFLDEIGEVPLMVQAKLLRVLESGEVMRLGSVRSKVVDVRFISATNRDLRELVAEGRFRADLFFRLNGVTVTLPPLRDRTLDVVPLAEAFARRVSERLGRSAPLLAEDAKKALEAYAWPGNVRELRNVVERAVVMTRGDLLGGDVLVLGDPEGAPVTSTRIATVPEAPPAPVSEATRPRSSPRDSFASLAAQIEVAEKQGVLEALAKTGGNQTQAAKLLGISRRGLIRKIEQYGITRPRKREGDGEDD